jgi:hypothetical protein
MRIVSLHIFFFVINTANSQIKTGTIEIVVTDIDYKKAEFLWIGLYNSK